MSRPGSARVTAPQLESAPWGTVRFAQKVLDEQGYIVLGHNTEQGPVGSEFQQSGKGSVFGLGPSDLGRLMIIGSAAAVDLENQASRFYPEECYGGLAAYKFYYKVTAE